MTSQQQNCGFLTAALCVACIAFSATVFAETAEEIHARGREAYDQVDMAGAMRNFRQAAEMGYAPAQAMLGLLLDAAEFNEEAREWYQRSADQGDIQGQLGLATMLASGEGGERDNPAALKWFSTAADSGSLEAMRILEQNFRAGGLGLDADAERADYWLNRAAEEGDRWSQEQLAARKADGVKD